MKTNTGLFLSLHLLIMLYSTSDIFSKLAGKEAVFNFRFIMYYGCVILLLGIYAIGWQQIIKRMPLSTAFANKAITTVWGTVWGVVFFHENLSIGKIIGIILVMAGIVLYSRETGDQI